MGQIILASASPRRKELLEQIGISFEICAAKGEERITKSVFASSIRHSQPGLSVRSTAWAASMG